MAAPCSGKGRRKSGGVALVWRKQLALCVAAEVIVKHRAVGISIKQRDLRALNVVAAYGYCSDTLAHGSKSDRLMTGIVEWLEARRGPT